MHGTATGTKARALLLISLMLVSLTPLLAPPQPTAATPASF